MDEERDILALVGDDGEEFEVEILDYFIFEDEEYALLTPFDEDCQCHDCDCDDEQELYILRVVINGDMEEFHPVDEDKINKLSDAVDAYLDEISEIYE